MSTTNYYGTYKRFQTKSKKDASVLLGADNIIGDVYNLEFLEDQGVVYAWLRNRFDQYIGFLDEDSSDQLRILDAGGMSIRAVLSLIAFTDSPAPGHYWGEVAIIALPASEEIIIDSFTLRISTQLKQGIRPNICLGKQSIEKLYRESGQWTPSDRIALPEKATGTAFLKTRIKPSEILIEKGRQRTFGCYFVSWGFLLILVAVVVFTLKSCGVF